MYLQTLHKIRYYIVFITYSFFSINEYFLKNDYYFFSLFDAGTKEERAVKSLVSMGPAVLNGGITTFLALLLLGFSKSHVFITFFKVSG